MNVMGMFVVLLEGVNQRFWSHLHCGVFMAERQIIDLGIKVSFVVVQKEIKNVVKLC